MVTIHSPVERDEVFDLLVEIDEDWDLVQVVSHNIEPEYLGNICQLVVDDKEPEFVLQDVMNMMKYGQDMVPSWIKAQIHSDLKHEKERYENCNF